MPHAFHSPRFNDSSKSVLTEVRKPPRYILPLRYKYFPHHYVFKQLYLSEIGSVEADSNWSCSSYWLPFLTHTHVLCWEMQLYTWNVCIKFIKSSFSSRNTSVWVQSCSFDIGIRLMLLFQRRFGYTIQHNPYSLNRQFFSLTLSSHKLR